MNKFKYMQRNADYWIEKLKMMPHPEGGFYKETYRSDEKLYKDNLPERYSGERNFSTCIFYLLKNDQKSKLHRLKSDEIWHFHDGYGMVIYTLDEPGRMSKKNLGLNIENGDYPQIIIKAGDWFGGMVSNSNTYCLAGCTVAPGFDFDDFEMGDRKKLFEMFPQHKEIIEQLTT